MQEIGLCAQWIGHKDAVRLEESIELKVRCGVFLDPTESPYLMATGGQVCFCVEYELGQRDHSVEAVRKRIRPVRNQGNPPQLLDYLFVSTRRRYGIFVL